MRVLNAQEIQQALEAVNDVPLTGQDQALKKEIVARSLWSIDGAYVALKEDVDEYNNVNSTQLTETEYKRVYVNSYEQYLVDFLYVVYTELQKKQIRRVMGLHMCAVCKNQYSKLPEKSYPINFDIAEMVCETCFPDVTSEDGFVFVKKVDFVQAVAKPAEEPPKVDETNSSIKKPSDFATLNEYRDYLIELADHREIQTTQVQ